MNTPHDKERENQLEEARRRELMQRQLEQELVGADPEEEEELLSSPVTFFVSLHNGSLNFRQNFAGPRHGMPTCSADGNITVPLVKVKGYQQTIILQVEGTNLHFTNFCVGRPGKPLNCAVSGPIKDTPFAIEMRAADEFKQCILVDAFESDEASLGKFNYTIHFMDGAGKSHRHDPQINNQGTSGPPWPAER